MKRVTPLKLAIVASGLRQKDIASMIGADEASLSRIVNGMHCDEARMQDIAGVLGRSVGELFGVDHAPESRASAVAPTDHVGEAA